MAIDPSYLLPMQAAGNSNQPWPTMRTVSSDEIDAMIKKVQELEAKLMDKTHVEVSKNQEERIVEMERIITELMEERDERKKMEAEKKEQDEKRAQETIGYNELRALALRGVTSSAGTVTFGAGGGGGAASYPALQALQQQATHTHAINLVQQKSYDDYQSLHSIKPVTEHIPTKVESAIEQVKKMLRN